MSSPMQPRVTALAAITRDAWGRGDEILVFDAVDPGTGERFHRMLGGGVEFGESGREAVIRELREEIDAQIVDVRWLGAVENHFEYGGRTGHEIVLVYTACFADESLYDRGEITYTEDDESPQTARWVSLADLDGGQAPLYPAGVRSLLDDAPIPKGSLPDSVVDKAVAYIVDRGRLLTFTHDEPDPITQSGLQVPAGTIEPGEPPEQAVLREAAEETGLDGLYVDRYLGTSDYDKRPARTEISRRHFYLLGVRGQPPERWDHHAQPENMTFRFRWLPVPASHVLMGGFGALLGAIPQRYLYADA